MSILGNYLRNVLDLPWPVQQGVEGRGEGEHREQGRVKVARVLGKNIKHKSTIFRLPNNFFSLMSDTYLI